MDLKDRVALVAGGTGLLGTAIARALAGAGADFLFEDRGARSLKGLPGDWRLFAVRA